MTAETNFFKNITLQIISKYYTYNIKIIRSKQYYFFTFVFEKFYVRIQIMFFEKHTNVILYYLSLRRGPLKIIITDQSMFIN